MTAGMGTALGRIQLGYFLYTFGYGLPMPFMFVYVAQVRGLGGTMAGVVETAFAVAAVSVAPFVGRRIDRRGPMQMVLVGSIVAAAGAFGLGAATSAPVAAGASAVLGAGCAVMGSSLSTMVVLCSSKATRSRVFAKQFFLANLAIGSGGVIGGMLADTRHPASFAGLFAMEAALFLALAAIMTTVRLPRTARIESATDVRARDRGRGTHPRPRGRGGLQGFRRRSLGGTRSGLRAVFADRSMVRLCVLAAAMYFGCYGQIGTGLPAFATQVTHINPSTLGMAVAANAAVIVVVQLLALRPVERHARSKVLAAVGVAWTLAWLVQGVSGLIHVHRITAAVAIISTYVLFGLGEVMLAPTLSPLVADLAPESMIGQYNALIQQVRQIANSVGPAVGGVMMGAKLYAPYILMLIGVSMSISVLARRLGQGLTAAQDQPLRAVKAEPHPAGRAPATPT